MEGFKFKLHTDELDFELEIEKLDLENETDKSFIQNIIKMIDRKSATMVEKMNKEEIKENVKDLAKGYKLHEHFQHSMNYWDEFVIQEAEEEMEEEEKAKTIIKDKKEEDKEEVESRSPTTENFANKEEEYRKKDLSVRTGSGNEKLYQTYYICPKCKDKNKKYIPRYAVVIQCKNCFHRMRIKNASLKGFPNKDKYGNIFVAGDFEVNEDTQLYEEN